MSKKTDKKKAKQCPQEEPDHEDYIPPGLATTERPLCVELASRCQAIQNDSPSILSARAIFFCG
jgi:hypothetical protein